MSGAIYAFEDAAEPARRLAGALDIPCCPVAVHRFPDGESLVRVPAPLDVNTAILYRSLDHPNDKIVELLLAASALRENGADRVGLVAPYLGYMRQDKAFNPGEAVSQRVIGSMLARHFDAVVTVDPHLHRIGRLGDVMPGARALSLTAAPALAGAIDPSTAPVLVGPDSESRQWVEAIAEPQGLDVLVGEKRRDGDREVEISIPGIERVRGRRAILVDDVISSGATLAVASRLLVEAGARGVEALATHCLASPEDLENLESAGIVSVRATDTVASAAASIPIAPTLAEGIRNETWFK